MPKERLHHFDLLKGVAIFLVVMGHVLTMCVRDIDGAVLFKIIARVHMPLFFFISGWFTWRDDRAPALGRRSLQLLLPMLVVSSLWILYFPASGLGTPLDSTFPGLWSDVWKNGYWFTPVLFVIIALYAAVARLMGRLRPAGCIALALAVWGALLALDFLALPRTVSDALSLPLVSAFWPAFVFGILARRYRLGFDAVVRSSVCQTVALAALAVTLYITAWPWEFGVSEFGVVLIQTLTHICLAVVALGVFSAWAARAYAPERSRPGRLAQMWELLGRESLAIYLLHYFFLFPMGWARPWLEATHLSVVACAAFSVFWAALITAAVLLTIALIRPSRLLSLLLTGSPAPSRK